MNTILNNRSTGVACRNTKRNFIGIEMDSNYFDIASKRMKHEQMPVLF